MQKSFFHTAAMLAFVAPLFISVRTAHTINCENLLANHSYLCQVKSEFSEFTDCFSFPAPGVLSPHFDMYASVLGDLLACDCKTTGTLAKTNFSASKEFHCVTAGDAPFGISFSGKAVGTKIKKGTAITEEGFTFVYECEQAACVASTAATQSQNNSYKK